MEKAGSATSAGSFTAEEIYTASVSQNMEDIQSYELLRGMEHTRNTLIERMLARIDTLNETLREEIVARRTERHQHDLQLQQIQLTNGIQELQLLKVRKDGDCYVLLLIDGDGLIFDDTYLARGEVGGKEAAGLLSSAVREHLTITLPDLPSNHKIVVRVYANVKGLAQTCHAAGIIESPSVLENFVRGFNGHKLHFDFVDVGSGKDKADGKIEALLGLHLGNLHCRQIILGVSHDNGYARQLEDISDSPRSSSIYLLEGVPFEKELAQLKSRFHTIKFTDLFRETKINLYHHLRQNTGSKRRTSLFDAESVKSSETDTDFSLATPSYNTTSLATPIRSPEPLVRTLSEEPAPISWAKLAGTKPPSRGITPLPPPASRSAEASPAPVFFAADSSIERNLRGDRIDHFFPTTTTEWRRIQQLHLCNIHFLRQECGYGDNCTHAHSLPEAEGGLPDGSLCKRDLEILTQVSRYAPCRNGTQCDDAKCIFGHRCPVQENEGKSGKGVGIRECKHGVKCKFPSEMHGIDTRVVKLLKV